MTDRLPETGAVSKEDGIVPRPGSLPEGFTIPAGRFHIDAAADRMVRATSGAPPGDGIVAHPIFAFIAAVGGLGMRIGDVFASAGGAIERGPVLAACTMHIHRPLRVGLAYQVIGTLLEVRRRPSRRFGHSDHLLLNIVLGSAGTDHAEVNLKVIVPADETGATAE